MLALGVDSCWFTVKEDNQAARGAARHPGRQRGRDAPRLLRAGDERIVSRIDRDSFAKLRARYERLGLIETTPLGGPQPWRATAADRVEAA